MKSSYKAAHDGQELDTTIAPATLEKWSRLAERLKGKLEATQVENKDLKERLRRKTVEYDDIKEEQAFSTERIDDLEFQCLEKSAKISNLSEIIESRGESSDLQEKLMAKSMEHAEMSLSVDRLRLALQKCESANQQLLHDKETLTMVNEQLSTKVEDATSAWHQSRKEQERNRKLLIEMGDVVWTLKCATSEFEKETEQGASFHNNPLQNIKRKIQAMEEDRKKLMRECESLKQENDSKHQKIQELETQFQSLSASRTDDYGEASSYVSGGRGPLDARLQSQTSPISIDTRELDEGERQHCYEQESDNDQSSRPSDVSFSDVRPPNVPYQEHETLKKYYEEALERIIRMSNELNNSKRTAKDMQEKDDYIAELKERLENMRLERDEVRHENDKLEYDLKEALGMAENATSNHVDVLRSYEKQKKDFTVLKEQYNQLEKDYSAQIGELENQVAETEKSFKAQCESLKKRHTEKLEEATKEREDLKQEHQKAIQAEKDKYDEMNDEFDLFMEMHTQLEDDMAELKGKYDEALSNIVDLEEQLETSQKTSKETKDKLQKRLDAQIKAGEDLKASLQKTTASLQEITAKEQKLRKEKDSILAKHGEFVTQLSEAKKKTKRDQATIAGLRENCCDMVERLKRSETTATTQSKQYQSSYDMALDKIKSLAFHLRTAGVKIEELPYDAMSKHKSAKGHDRIKMLERELMGDKTADNPNAHDIDNEEEGFPRDYARILKTVIETELPEEDSDKDNVVISQKREDDGRGTLYERILHQVKLHQIHGSLLDNFSQWMSHGPSNTTVGDSPSRNGTGTGALTEQGPVTEDVTTGLVDPYFLKHQRKKNVVNAEVIARGPSIDMIPSSEKIIVSSDQHAEASGYREGEVIDKANSKVQRSAGETHKITMATNTAKIRYEAREKDHRVIRLQYQKLLEQYNAAVEKQKEKDAATASSNNEESQSSSPPNKVKLAVQRIQQNSELQRLQDELRNAELKMERMAIELRATKSKTEVSQQEDGEGEKSLQNETGYHEPECQYQQQLGSHGSLEQGAGSDPGNPVSPSPEKPFHTTAVSQVFRNKAPPSMPVVEERRQEDSSDESRQGNRAVYQPPISFDGSHLTSLAALSHGAEGREEKWEGEKNHQIQFEGGIGRYLQLQQEHDQALRTIESLKNDLSGTEKSAENARTQLKDREEDLREVIREYNQIKDECDKLFEQIQEKVKEDESSDEKKDEDGDIREFIDASKEDLVRERNVALGKISMLETELEKAKTATKAARKKQMLREDHLRQVIEQYKVLKQEHQKTKEHVKQLQAKLRQPQEDSTSRTKHTLAPMPPGMESRQRSHESEGNNREAHPQAARRDHAHRERKLTDGDDSNSKVSQQSSKTSQKSKTKRKRWFLDLGYNKRENQQSC